MTTGISYEIFQGDTFSQNVIVSGESGPITFSGQNLSGIIKYTHGCTGFYNLGVTIVSSGSGLINLNLTHLQSEQLPAGRAFYQVQVSGFNEVSVPVFGQLFVYPVF